MLCGVYVMKIDSSYMSIGKYPLEAVIQDIRGEGGVMMKLNIAAIQQMKEGGRVQVRLKEGKLCLFMFKYTDTPKWLHDYICSTAKWWADAEVVFDTHLDLPTESEDTNE